MPITEKNWQQLQGNLEAARTLAAFLDIGPNDWDNFRQAHPNFLYQMFWQPTQKEFQEIWDEGFPQDRILEVVSDDPMFFNATVDETGTTESGKPYRKSMKGENFQRGFTYKKAFLFLFTEPWRARICRYAKCRRHFIAEKSGSRCCSKECAAKHRIEYKRENWADNADTVNARRREDYDKQMKSKQRAREKRENSAKRKNLRQR